MDHGADIAAVNNEGELPLDLAEDDEMEEYLQDQLRKSREFSMMCCVLYVHLHVCNTNNLNSIMAAEKKTSLVVTLAQFDKLLGSYRWQLSGLKLLEMHIETPQRESFEWSLFNRGCTVLIKRLCISIKVSPFGEEIFKMKTNIQDFFLFGWF